MTMGGRWNNFKHMRKPSKRQRWRNESLSSVLIMQGYYAIQVAELLNVHRETISSYVKKFNHGGMEALIHRDYSPGKPPFLSPERNKK